METVPPEAIRAIAHPSPADWPTYSGDVRGNRYSSLREINERNVSSLRQAWVHPLPYDPLETTPVVMDAVMYVTGPNQVYALDARTGGEIWHYSRPRSAASGISGDAAKGAQRGVAVLGDRVFFITDNAHLICLHRLTGALLWDVAMPEDSGKYGGTSAPLVAGDLVIAGVSGGDEGVRGFVAAYRATSGEQAWRFWTVPKADEAAAATWQGDASPQGGTTWTTPSYDPDTGVLYVGVGNPYPDTDGDDRGGDNLYTDSDLALDAKTGKLLWYFQFTPHDVHDWDANQPLVLIDAPFRGLQRKLLLHANRNGFFYVLDRTSGKLLLASALVRKLTWASGIGPDGRPILLPANETTLGGAKTCPAVRGATNWYSTSYNPLTGLYYVMTVEDCSLYRKAHDGGYGFINDPADPAHKVLRALAIDTGKIVWELSLIHILVRNSPAEYKQIGAAELAYINAGIPVSSLEARRSVKWRELVLDRQLGILTLSYACYGYVAYMFFTWFFKYLSDVRGLNLKASALYATLPFIAMAIASSLGGLVSDRLLGLIGKRAARCGVRCV